MYNLLNFLESTFLSISIARIHKILGGAGHMKDLLGPEGCRNFEPHLTLTCNAHRNCLAYFQFYSDTCHCVVFSSNGVVLQPNRTL